jgi:hypothetical protein
MRIYITLERRTPPASFRAYGPRLVPTFNYFQTAACLFEDGQLTLPSVAKVAESLRDRSGYTPERLANSLADIVRRGHVGETAASALHRHLTAQHLLPRATRLRRQPLWRRMTRWMRRVGSTKVTLEPLRLDYRQLAAELRSMR